MASNSLLLRLQDVTHRFGGGTLFSSANVDVHAGDRIALVGRNGCGKSTLLKLLSGSLEAEFGERVCAPGVRIGHLPQSAPIVDCRTLGEFAQADLPEDQAYRVRKATRGLNFAPETLASEASGGELRKAAIARLLAVRRSVMLMDEPTNHLDVEAILWLERRIRELHSAIVIVSHDRLLLKNVTTKTLWIDRGVVRLNRKGFECFEEWKERVWTQEEISRRKLDKRIVAESEWATQGISARRKRNQGRLRALESLKSKRAELGRARFDPMLTFTRPLVESRLVIEARNLSLRFGRKHLVSDFSVRIMKGDRIAVIGPNGSGKSTLLKVLCRKIKADSGKIKTGYRISLAAMWQERKQLNPKVSVRQFLVGKGANARDRPEFVIVGGKQRHVKSYIRDFQFEHWQSDSPIGALSGGEWGRLLLAKILLEDCNLLVLDEPTNDLDVDMLEKLQDALAKFEGTVIFVSHDREFIDQVATVTIANAGDGKWIAYAGGWSDYLSQAQLSQAKPADDQPRSVDGPPNPAREQGSKARVGLTFTELHRLESMPEEVLALENRIEDLAKRASSEQMSYGDFACWQELSLELDRLQQELQELEDEWVVLLEKEEASRILEARQ
ncbi:MAG: ABC-F family ATP-binding cassette domain-containing protein [Rhodobacteraceae bacterium]|nr:ABC-F family ATP-binding cassette domain-containing protein [Paracoccaceae bacterium]